MRGEQITSLTRTGPDWRKRRPTPVGGSLCQESASGDPDGKGRGSGRWAGGKDNKAAGKDLLLGRGAMRPVAGVAVETPRRIQSLTYSLNTYLLLQAQCHPVEGQRKRGQSLSSESFPHPDTHCLELNSEGLYNQREGTYPTWSLEPTEKGHSRPHP